MLMRSIMLLAFGALAPDPATAATAPVETTPFELVQTFLSQIGTFERDRLQAAKEQTADPKDFASCVRNMTTFQIHLGYTSKYLLSVKPDDRNMAKSIPPLIGAIINQSTPLWAKLSRTAKHSWSMTRKSTTPKLRSVRLK